MLRLTVVTMFALFVVAAPTLACKEEPDVAGVLAPDDLLQAIPTIEPVPNCPVPGCAPPPPWQPCPVYNGTPPFVRHSSISSGPISAPINCFAVAREPNGDYYMFTGTNTGNNVFERLKSTDQGVTWTSLGSTQPFSASWIGSVQCPDPHFTSPNGSMTMIYTVRRTVSGGGSVAVGRAESTDYGHTWTNLAELVAPTSSHYPYMPSQIELPASIGGGYLLAYTWVCKGSPIAIPTIDVLFSQDGITNWQPRAVPGIPTGACNKWDDGSVNRPRLILDPVDPSTVHAFYSAYEWNGVNQPTRNCGRIGQAISTDAGFTWVKKVRPVFEPDQFSWNNEFVLKPTLVVERCGANTFLRLFYEGRGSTASGLGIADAPWPYGSAGCPSAELALGQVAPEDDEEQPPARLTSAPNPARGTTSIGVDLSRVSDAGEAELMIVDVTGRLVRSLWTGSTLTAPSAVEWDGRESGGSRVVPGRYLARLRQGDATLGTHWITMTR